MGVFGRSVDGHWMCCFCVQNKTENHYVSASVPSAHVNVHALHLAVCVISTGTECVPHCSAHARTEAVLPIWIEWHCSMMGTLRAVWIMETPGGQIGYSKVRFHWNSVKAARDRKTIRQINRQLRQLSASTPTLSLTHQSHQIVHVVRTESSCCWCGIISYF